VLAVRFSSAARLVERIPTRLRNVHAPLSMQRVDDAFAPTVLLQVNAAPEASNGDGDDDDAPEEEQSDEDVDDELLASMGL
jgi:hypothetical protein